MQNFLQIIFTKEDEEILSFKHDYTKYHILKEWIKNNPKKALIWQGNYGETLLHWAIINNLEVSKNLIQYTKIDINCKDNKGLTPFDWLLDRFIVNVVRNSLNISEEGRVFIMNQTIRHAIYLYDNNAKSTKYDVIDTLSATGAYDFIYHIYNKYNITPLISIGENKKSILHNWIFLGESLEKHQKLIELLDKFKIDINITDKENRTPLFYAIDSWISKPELTDSFWIPTIKSLLRQKSDPFLNSIIPHPLKEGEFLNPYNLFNLEIKKEKELFKIFNNLIEETKLFLSDKKEKEKILNKEYEKLYLKKDKVLGLKYSKWLSNLKPFQKNKDK